MRNLIPLLLVPIVLSGCSTMLTAAAEVTGLSVLHDRRTSMMLVKDERIEINAGIKLNSNDETRKKCHFNITAYNGIVLVTGEAPTERLRKEIIQIVRTISGVKLVHNEMVLGSLSSIATRSSDTIITTKIKSSLSNIKNLPGFDATRIKVITESGVVYLLGLVHEQEGHVATEIARRETGVKQVVKVFEIIKYKS